MTGYVAGMRGSATPLLLPDTRRVALMLLGPRSTEPRLPHLPPLVSVPDAP